jgi:hypothetical protein
VEINLRVSVKGHITITDVTDKKNPVILVDKDNQINYETMSIAIADTLSDRGFGAIYQMAFGNGGASVSDTGVITYLPPNVTGLNAALYNQTYEKVVDDRSVYNLDPTRNRMSVLHTSGKVYTDILVQCLLDYGEPPGQAAFDNSTQTDSSYIFDELGLLAYYGTNASGEQITRLLTHVIFHPVQKSLNRQIQIDYTVRIQALTSQV